MARINLNDLPKPKWQQVREVEIMAWGRGEPILKRRSYDVCPNCGDDITVRMEPKGTFCAECGLKLETCCEGAPLPSGGGDYGGRQAYENPLF